MSWRQLTLPSSAGGTQPREFSIFSFQIRGTSETSISPRSRAASISTRRTTWSG